MGCIGDSLFCFLLGFERGDGGGWESGCVVGGVVWFLFLCLFGRWMGGEGECGDGYLVFLVLGFGESCGWRVVIFGVRWFGVF